MANPWHVANVLLCAAVPRGGAGVPFRVAAGDFAWLGWRLERDKDRDGHERYHLCFRYGGRRYKGTLKTTSSKEAQVVRGGADKILYQLETGLRVLPDEADLLTFVLTGGTPAKVKSPERLTLKELFREFLDQLPAGALESNSLKTVKIHMRHFLILGRKFLTQGLTLEQLQRYINRRLTMKGRRGTRRSRRELYSRLKWKGSGIVSSQR